MSFTFGIGCYASAAGAAALAASSAANTIGAIKDHNQISPLAKVIDGLPGATEKQRKAIATEENKATGRVLGGAVETALSVPGLSGFSRGKKVLTSAETFRPIASSTVYSDTLFSSATKQMDELTKMGVGFEKSTDHPTSLQRSIKYGWDRYKYVQRKTEKDFYGEILEISKLPKASGKASVFGNALKHPEMETYLKKMKDMGYDLVVDTSIKGTGVGAYFSPAEKVIALQPNSSWQTFIHEFQHLQFEEFITGKFDKIQTAVQKEGKSIKDVLSPQVVQQYGDREINRLQNLIQKGHTELGVNESMATARELDALGWKQFVPVVGTGPRTYGASHRVHELSQLREKGIQLTDIQEKSLKEGRAEMILTHAYEIGVSAAAANSIPTVISKTIDGGYQVQQAVKTFYNEKTGEMIVHTPDGRFVGLRLGSK